MANFYLPDGSPFYEVENKSKGGMRPATIADARKAGASPGVTSIIDIPAKPQLIEWRITQGILAALTNPHIKPGMSEQEILATLKRDAEQQVKDAVDAGTAVHDAIEAAFKGKPVPKQYQQTVDAVVALLYDKCGSQAWEAEKHFCSPLGYGGKIDLISDEWIIDFKTKPGDAATHKMYDEQLMQLVAYDFGMDESPLRRKANVIVSRAIPGSVAWWAWDVTIEDEYLSFAKFHNLLAYWQASNRHGPFYADAMKRCNRIVRESAGIERATLQ